MKWWLPLFLFFSVPAYAQERIRAVMSANVVVTATMQEDGTVTDNSPPCAQKTETTCDY